MRCPCIRLLKEVVYFNSFDLLFHSTDLISLVFPLSIKRIWKSVWVRIRNRWGRQLVSYALSCQVASLTRLQTLQILVSSAYAGEMSKERELLQRTEYETDDQNSPAYMPFHSRRIYVGIMERLFALWLYASAVPIE